MMRIVRIVSRQPWVEARFALRFPEPASVAALESAAVRALRQAVGRGGSTNWLMDNGCFVTHRLSSTESVISASCVAASCVVDPLVHLAAIHDLLVAESRAGVRRGRVCEPKDRAVYRAAGSPAERGEPVNCLVIGGPAELVASIIDRIEARGE